MDKTQEFLDKLKALIKQFNVEFYYTTDDDGIHISVDGKDVGEKSPLLFAYTEEPVRRID